MKLGIIREEKTPVDLRTPLIPKHCKTLLEKHSELEIYLQESPHRAFKATDYEAIGVKLVEDASHCDILMGVKEVPIENLIPNKSYLFFSHTAKEQAYNRKLLQAILQKKITLIDYEYLTNEKGHRLVAFGRFAGIVGMHNGLKTWGKRTKTFDLQAANETFDFEALKNLYQSIDFPAIKIVVTGGGRVAKGAIEVLKAAKIKEVNPNDFLNKNYEEAVFVQLKTEDLYIHPEKENFDKNHFFEDPKEYKSLFEPYTKVCDLMVNAIYWNPEAPIYFSKKAMQKADFKIKVIADITCDIEGSIPATLRATSIANPVMGYEPMLEKEIKPFQENGIDIMSVDNLPCELPRDASTEFGDYLVDSVMEDLLQKGQDSSIINRATIAQNGNLGAYFTYLNDFVNQK